MAGKETRGVEEAEADLFAGRTYVLTPEGPQDLETPAAASSSTGSGASAACRWSSTPPSTIAWCRCTSHLPQLASTALAATLARRLDIEKYASIAGPGLMDMTRLAMSSYDIWRDILATNSGEMEHALDAYISELRDLRAFLVDRRMEQEFEVAADFASRIRRKEEENA